MELVIPPGNQPSPGKLLDLEMLVIASGKERTEAEYAATVPGYPGIFFGPLARIPHPAPNPERQTHSL